MNSQNFTTTFSVRQSPKDVFNAINDVRGWWSENIKGSTDQLNSEFTYRDKYLNAKIKITQLSLQKIVWDVLETNNDFFEDNKEWDGTRIIFDINKQPDGETAIIFTHLGLNPQFECYHVCSNAWEYFISTSLKSLIETGKGKEISTDDNSYTTSFVVDASPKSVFEAINNVRDWWSEEIEGDTQTAQSTFFYHYRDVHLSKMKIVESVPYKRVVWFVIENSFNFTKDQAEWTGNKIIFELSKLKNETKLTFTQHGLTPRNECYDVCEKSWTSYIQGSLKNLITTGVGQPNKKEERPAQQ